MKKILFFLVTFALILTACAGINQPFGSTAPQATYTPLPTYTPYPTTAPVTAIPTQAQPTQPAPVNPTAQPGSGSYQTFTYTPGGESFGMTATDVILPPGESNCFRMWQATNLKNTAWTAIFCNWKASNPTPKQQWPHPMQLTVSGTGTVEFDLYRDFAKPDEYDVANAQKSPLGLGWFTQGFNGTTCINGQCQDLSGGGVFQMSFPKDWTDHYHVVITVNNGQVQFWQGERATSTDNWPLP